jgi:hypothetical protein
MIYTIKEKVLHGWVEHALLCARHAEDLHDCDEALSQALTKLAELAESISDRKPSKRKGFVP